ncbi:MAG: 5-methyltetrahydropteroyltriglutamate--homocysteine methyltransferase, partial [Gaiellales bacterium]|nr:5-methyltetrahydropteroyltriglutamate--homocysteine methyltransferase [Gaiellales bacterium]
MGHIRTTHVGSLIRPPALLPFLRAIENGEPYDKDAYQECLRSSVDDVVRQQVETGIDIVS